MEVITVCLATSMQVIRHELKIGEQLESGNVALNSIAPHMYAPFGGFKMSGVGRDRGRWGLEAYSEIQAINWPS